MAPRSSVETNNTGAEEDSARRRFTAGTTASERLRLLEPREELLEDMAAVGERLGFAISVSKQEREGREITGE